MACIIPVIDVRCLNIDIDDQDIKSGCLEEVAVKLVHAFSKVGFVYLENHGIPRKLIDEANNEIGKFFHLPIEIKERYRRAPNSNHGWVSTEFETLNPERPGDLKEAFNVTPAGQIAWPDSDTINIRPLSEEIMTKCEKLSFRLLWALAKGLNLKDPDFFTKSHNVNRKDSMTTLRYLFYPPVSKEVKPGQLRCGEHTDYGTLTLLFQDDVGGLQVLSHNGEWVDARPIPDTIVVNIGALMQRWTSDRLLATKHRVIIPEAEVDKRSTVRRSLAYFLHPDDDVIVKCVDGSNKYPPVSALDYVKSRFAATYDYN